MSEMIKKTCNLGFSQSSFIELVSLGDVWISNKYKITCTCDVMAGFGWGSTLSHWSHLRFHNWSFQY